MNNQMQTLDYIANRLQYMTPDQERVCESADHITARYNHRLQKLKAPDEESRLLAYLYTENNATTDELHEWYNYADLYLDRLGEHVNNIIIQEKQKIQIQKQYIDDMISKKTKYVLYNNECIRLDTKHERIALSILNRLPTDIVRMIKEYIMTTDLLLIISKVDIAILQKVKNAFLKGFLKELKRRSTPLLKTIRKEAIRMNYLRHADVVSLENIHGSGTKHDMILRIEKVIACYLYCINIIQHKYSCDYLTYELQEELLYIYRTCKYINKISKRR